MKPPLISALIPAVAIGGMALILGCGDESRKVAAPVAGAGISAAVTNAESNKTDLVSTIPDVLPVATVPPKLSASAEQVVQLAQAMVGDEVLLAFIEQSSGGFHLKVEEILYLHDVGLSAPVIAAMVRRDEDASTAKTDTAIAENFKAGSAPAQPGAATDLSSSVSSPEVEQASVSLSSETPQTAAREESVSYNYFYDSLAPYGSWVVVPSYGWCWQPTVATVNPNWRPYCDNGRWFWSNSGWYWQSSYSWGWGPFHYGRWFCGPSGWAWTPGTVWGPSWVTWCNSGAFTGWAPLPPSCGFTTGVGLTFGGSAVGVSFGFGLANNCWTFVPRSLVCSSSPWSYCVPGSRVPAMVNNGTIVNNYINGSGNNVVINAGPGVNQIAAVSRTEIRKVTLRDADAPPGRSVQADRLDRAGGTLTVFRPNLPQQAPAPPEHILARQQEVRRNSETLVKSEVVRLAQAETIQRATTSTRSGASVQPRAVTAPPRSVSTASLSTSAARSELRASQPVQSATPQAVNSGGSRQTAPVRAVSGSINNPRQPASRTEARNAAGAARQPVQWTSPQNTTTSPARNNSAPRTLATPAPAYATVPNANRAEVRSPANRPTGFSPRSYAPTTPAPTPVIQSRPVSPGYAPPRTTAAPRSYAPAAPAPAMRSAPVRSSPSPSYSPGPAPSRSQPSGPPSSGGRSGPGRATP